MVLAEEAEVRDVTWHGRADRGRVAMLDDGVTLEQTGVRLPGPLGVAVVWIRPSLARAERLTHLFAGCWSVRSELGFWFDRVLVLTNLDAPGAKEALARHFVEV